VADSTLTAAAALDAIEEGVLVHDSRQLVYANRAAGELLGVDRDDLRALADVAPPCQCVSESGTPLKDDEWPTGKTPGFMWRFWGEAQAGMRQPFMPQTTG